MGFQIAIDGPVAAGKGTVSRKVADRLGFVYVDTGATYRAATLVAIEKNIDMDRLRDKDRDEVARLVEQLKTSEIELKKPAPSEMGRLVTVKINGEDQSDRIRELDVTKLVPVVSAVAQVRELMVKLQQEIAGREDVVMEGRDITYRVLPEAQVKIYLDASLEERARRRWEDYSGKGIERNLEQVLAEVKERDELDMSRPDDPLKKIEGVWEIDSSKMTIDEVVELICERVGKMRVGVGVQLSDGVVWKKESR